MGFGIKHDLQPARLSVLTAGETCGGCYGGHFSVTVKTTWEKRDASLIAKSIYIVAIHIALKFTSVFLTHACVKNENHPIPSSGGVFYG